MKNDKWKIWVIGFVLIAGSMAVGIGIGMGIYANSSKAKGDANQTVNVATPNHQSVYSIAQIYN